MGGLEDFIRMAEEIDKETHSAGQDLVREKMYDVDWVNLRRILTGREAANIYLALQEYEGLVLTSSSLELPTMEMVNLSDGRRMVPASDVQARGYNVYSGIIAPGVETITRVLTFAERQLPTEKYKTMFKEHLKSDINLNRARELGFDRVSPYVGEFNLLDQKD